MQNTNTTEDAGEILTRREKNEVFELYSMINQAAVTAADTAQETRDHVHNAMMQVHRRLDTMSDSMRDTQIDVAEIKAKMVTKDQADHIISNHVAACDHELKTLMTPAQFKFLLGAIGALAAAATALIKVL